jgi:Protein of unknown function (DUF3102)
MSAVITTPAPEDGERLPLSDLAERINRGHDELIAQAGSMLERVRHVGADLLRAKAQLPHGEWLPWLQVKCPRIHERTARNYMRVAEFCAERPDAADKLGYTEILSALATPKTERVSDLPATTDRMTLPRVPPGRDNVAGLVARNEHEMERWFAQNSSGALATTRRIVRHVETSEPEIVYPKRVINTEPEITIDMAVATLLKVKRCQPLLERHNAQEHIVLKLRLQLKRAEARLAKVGASVIEAAKAALDQPQRRDRKPVTTDTKTGPHSVQGTP